MAEFSHLHLHTHYSLLDGAIRLAPLFKAASEDKMEAVAITDHGNMFGVLDFYYKAKDHGIKPILGCEVYLAPGSRHMRATHTSGDDEQPPYLPSRSGIHHLVLLAMNEQGYHNLCRIVSIGYMEGFYYKPRVDKEVLQQYNEGLIALSGDLKGEVTHLCLLGEMERAKETAKWYKDTFKDRFYLEMQQNGLPQHMILAQRFQQLAKDLSLPLVASADCHYLKKEDALAQEILMCIQMGKSFDDPENIQLRSDEFYFKSQQAMKESFQFCPEAIANTMEIANRCNFEFKLKDASGKRIFHFPKFDPPDGETLESFLKIEAEAGLKERFVELEEDCGESFSQETKAEYWKRLEKELGVICEMGFAGYFLIVADFIKFAKKTNVPVGPGRGSGAGSLVAYALRITDLDPIEHGLIFERFLNPERVSLPDFDVDFCMDKRDQVIQYVVDKYGKDSVAQIITFGKLQARGVIRDVGRVFGMPASEMDRIAKLVPATLNITLEQALEQEPRLKQLTETDPKINKLIEVCRSLEGLCRHASIHAAGLVISNGHMVEHCPLYRGKEGELVIQFDMNNAEKIGLIKFDFLGLKTLTFLQRAQELVNQRDLQAGLDLSRISLSDNGTYELLCRGDTLGIFQLESSGMQDLVRKVRPDQFPDIVAINALYRPGPIGSGMLDDFIARKHGEANFEYDFSELEPILRETYGVIAYQEQVQQIAVKLANYTLGGADILRRAMGKKKPAEMAKQKAIFLKGAVEENKHSQEKIEKLFDLMEKFAGYGFNKSHSAAYGVISCQTAYLKAHHLVEFYAALLSIERENTDKITRYIADAKRHGIAVLPPDINESETDFTVLSDTQIRFGLGAIKGVGQTAIDTILEARRSEGEFEDLFDLASRANTRTVNKRVMEALVKAGAFDSFKVHRASLMAAVDDALDVGGSIQKTRDDNQSSFLDIPGMDDPSLSHRTMEYPDRAKWNRLLELKYEKETIGIFVTGHPLDDFAFELKRYTTDSVGSCLQAAGTRECFIGAQVSGMREIITKRGDRMAFATLEDCNHQIEAVIFSDVFLESELTLKSGEPVWVRAQLERGEAGNKLILSKKSNAKILPLRHAYEVLAREIHIHLPIAETDQIDKAKFAAFQNFIRASHRKDGAPLFLHFNLDGRADAVLRLNGALPIKREVVSHIGEFFEGLSPRVEFQ